MLLVPKRDQRRLDPVPDGPEPMDSSVAGGAEGNQKPRVMNAGPAMVNRQLPLRPTGLTAAAVAIEHGFAVAGEAEAGMRLPRIAIPAQAGAKQLEAAAGAEKPGLPARRKRRAEGRRGRARRRSHSHGDLCYAVQGTA